MFAQFKQTAPHVTRDIPEAFTVIRRTLPSSFPITSARRILPCIILLMLCVIQAHAQTANCAPPADCSWTYRTSALDLVWYVNPGCAGCKAEVDYRFRAGCNNGTTCEIEILSIKFWGTCNTCTVGDIIKYSIITSMLYGCGFPDPGQCSNNIKVWMAACLKKINIGDFAYITQDCYNESCCSAEYKLCRLGTGGFMTLTRTDSGTLPTQPCSTIDLYSFYPTTSFTGCFMACDAMPEGELDFEATID